MEAPEHNGKFLVSKDIQINENLYRNGIMVVKNLWEKLSESQAFSAVAEKNCQYGN